jgi:tetratricopeptide (TPR) repeat protein
MHTDSSPRPTWLVILGLLILGMAVFAQVRDFGFSAYDDTIYVSENPTISAGLTWSGIKEVTLEGHHLLWTPITSLSYMVGCEIYGLNPAGHHLTNLLLHLCGVLLLFYTLLKLTGAFWPSAFVAAVFAIHPLNVEPVAWISGRKEQLFIIFWLLSLLAYARYAKKPGVLPYLLVLLCHLAGLASKPTHLMLPAVLMLIDFWPLDRVDARAFLSLQGWKRLVLLALEKVPLFALSAAVTLWTISTVQDAGGLRDFSSVPLSERIPNTIWVYGWYLKQTLLPAGLTVHYPYPEVPVGGLPLRGILMVLVFITLVSITYLRRFPVIAVGWGWFVLVLLPTSGLLRANSFLMADRYAYVPMIGLLIMAAWGIPLFIQRFTRATWLPGLIGALFLLSLIPNAYRQTSYWKDDLSLWGHAVQVIPESPVAHNSYGRALREAGRLQEAEEQFLLAIAAPGPFRILPHMNLGTLYASAGHLEAAQEHFETVVNGNPSYAPGYRFLGLVLLDRAKVSPSPDAMQEQGHLALATAVYLDPTQADAVQRIAALPEDARPSEAEIAMNLAQRFERLGRQEEANAYYEKVAEKTPNDAGSLRRLADLLARRGRFEPAQTLLYRALEAAPADLATALSLGQLLLMDNKPEAAAAVYDRALEHHPDDTDLLLQVGRAQAAAGDAVDARATFEKVLDVDPGNQAAQIGLHQMVTTMPPLSLQP